ncbi:MAG: S9 family peptidase [Bdellovibrionaceae bacterium]|nr:S9 family peptidase [Pseudobdellovibrionaceae bacterium]
MRVILVLCLASLFAASCSTRNKNASLQSGAISLETFFRNPVASSVSISPNGEMLAALMPFKGRMNVFVRDIKGGEWNALTKVDDRDIAGIQWKTDNTILFIKDFGGDENFHVFSVNLSSKEVKDLTPFAKVRAQIIDTLDGVFDNEIVVGINKRDPRVFDVYKVNVITGALTLILENTKTYVGYLFDHKGNLRMTVASDGVNNDYFYRDAGKKDFRKIMSLDFKDSFAPVAFDKNNKNIYAISNIKRNTAAAVEVNPRNGHEIQTIFSNPDYDVTGLQYSKERKELIEASFTDWKMEQHVLSPYYKEIYGALKAEITDKEVVISNSNKNETRMVVVTYSDRTQAQYYIYDVTSKKLTFLLDSAPWMKPSELAEMKPVSYKSRDGLIIHGYLTLPKNKGDKNLPVVINPHGGPWARDMWRYNPQVQFLANRGYAVLQMNFRGSTGYGRKFWEASFKQWGLKMQDDITDGVEWLISQGIADKNRVAIYGGSYGGYAVLAGLAFTPDLYRCGVDYVGVSNIFTLMQTVPPYWQPMRDKFYKMIGHPEKEKDLIEKASPLFSANKIKAPLLVVQGAQDPRVKKSESDQIVEALKKRGVDVPYLVKENEGHGFRNEENRFEFYRTMETFLDKHMTKM